MIWASKAFQIVRAARELCISKSAGPVRRKEGSTPLTLSTFFLPIHESIQLQAGPSNSLYTKDKATLAKRVTVKAHLTARCAGLLEVSKSEQEGPQAVLQFLHRTARDFLYKDEI